MEHCQEIVYADSNIYIGEETVRTDHVTSELPNISYTSHAIETFAIQH